MQALLPLLRRHPGRIVVGVLLLGLLWVSVPAASVDVLPSRHPDPGPRVFTPKEQALRERRPLNSFQANLYDDQGYVTAFRYGGFTNQLFNLVHLCFVARRTNRVAILPELWHSHEGRTSELSLPWSTFFDLDAWMSASGVSIVEWSAVKWPGRDADAQNALVPETLNCWGTGVDYQPLSEYRISTTFSPVPEHLLVNGRLTLASVELLLASSNSAWASNATDSSHWEQTPPPPPPRAPGVRVACFQHLFSMYSIRWRKGIAGTFAIPEDFSLLDPQWREVGQHLRFNDHIRAVGDALLAAVLGSTTTPFIGVHLRQGDFLRINRTSTSTEDYQDAVLAVDKELRQRLLLRYRTLPVVVATDSEDPQYHAKIKALDWRLIDHTAFNTSARYSPWYPGVLDAYILSKSIGFVGTRRSTYTNLAAARVKTWNDGVVRIV